MSKDLRGKGLQTKQENGTDQAGNSAIKTPINLRPWLGLKDPRIVRVSRSFGGKDRHSKVRTVRGLRDRRVRLSVPTAIQLYDLQERLGLNQPSKVVDWLLNASQHEIDKLPPLQVPHGSFAHFSHPSTIPPDHEMMNQPQLVQTSTVQHDQDNWNSDICLRTKVMESTMDQEINGSEKDASSHRGMLLADGLVSLPGLMPNGAIYTSYYQFEPAGISNLGANVPSHEDHTSSLSLMPNSQLMLCTSGTVPSMFQPYASASSGHDYDNLKQINHYHMVNAASQGLLPSSLPSSFQPVTPTTSFFGNEHIHRVQPFSKSPHK